MRNSQIRNSQVNQINQKAGYFGFALFLIISTATPVAHTAPVNICKGGLCVDVDLCTGLNGRGEPVARNQWLHRRQPSLWVAGDDAMYNGGQEPLAAYNFYAIDSVEISRGARVRTCEPDFAIMRESGLDTCNNKTKLEHTCSQASCSFVSDSNRVQMIWLGFQESYGCFTAPDATQGHYLTHIETPNAVLPCTINTPPNRFGWEVCDAEETDCCDFECVPGYIINETSRSCEPKCHSPTLECTWGYHASEAPCTDMGAPRYNCVPCEIRPGQHLENWDASTSTQCTYQDCNPGQYGDDNTCKPCPANTFSDTPASSVCTPCAAGYESGGGLAACQLCFLADLDSYSEYPDPYTPSPINCNRGEMISRNVTTTLHHLTSAPVSADASVVARAWCDQGYACLPCAPGSFAQNDVTNYTCAPCDYGHYQSDWGQTSCHACAHGQSTLRQGAVRADECRCVGGFE